MKRHCWFDARVIKTVSLFCSYICMGLYNEVIGPSLPDIRTHHRLSNEAISRALSLGCAGMFGGSLFGGFAFDRFPMRRHAWLAAVMGLASVTVSCLPFCRTVWQLTLTVLLLGVCQGFHSTGVGPILVDLWGLKATGPLNLIHGGYFVGFALAPILLSAFLPDRRPIDLLPAPAPGVGAANWTAAGNLTGPAKAGATAREALAGGLHHIVCAYLVIGVLCCLCGVAFAATAVHERLWETKAAAWELEAEVGFVAHHAPAARRPSSRSVQQQRRRSSTFAETWREVGRDRRQATLTVLLLVTSFFLFFANLGSDRLVCRFVFTFVSEGPLGMGRREAYIFNTMVGVSFALARFGVVLAAALVHTEVMLAAEIAGFTVLAGAAAIFQQQGASFWFIFGLLCLFKSPVHPTAIGVLNRYLPVSGVVQLVINCGSGLGAMALLWLCGFLMDSWGHAAFAYILAAQGLPCVIGAALLVTLGRLMRRRQKEWAKRRRRATDAGESLMEASSGAAQGSTWAPESE